MDGRVRSTDFDREAPRRPARLLTQLTDPRLLLRWHPSRRAMRTPRALLKAHQRRPLLRARRPPASNPLPDRRLRDVRPGSCLGERLTKLLNTTNDLATTPRSETGSMVRHSGPP